MSYSRYKKMALNKTRELDYMAGRPLSPREKDILIRVAMGLGTADIAGQLGIAEQTTQNYIRSIYGKTGLWNRVQLAIYALKEGYITLEEL